MFHRARVIAEKPPPKSYTLLKFRGNDPDIFRCKPAIPLPSRLVNCEIPPDGLVPAMHPAVYSMGRYYKERYVTQNTIELLFATEIVRYMMSVQNMPYLPFAIVCVYGAPFENAFTRNINIAIAKILKTPNVYVQHLLVAFLRQPVLNEVAFLKQEKFLRRMLLDDGYSESAFLQYCAFVALSSTVPVSRGYRSVPNLAVFCICDVVRDFKRAKQFPLDAWDRLHAFATTFLESN